MGAQSRRAGAEVSVTPLAAGAQPANEPIDMGSMYGWSFQDPDGHLWEVVWIDPSMLEEGAREEQSVVTT